MTTKTISKLLLAGALVGAAVSVSFATLRSSPPAFGPAASGKVFYEVEDSGQGVQVSARFDAKYSNVIFRLDSFKPTDGSSIDNLFVPSKARLILTETTDGANVVDEYDMVPLHGSSFELTLPQDALFSKGTRSMTFRAEGFDNAGDGAEWSAGLNLGF